MPYEVEVEGLPALLVLDGIDHPHPSLDAGAQEMVGERERQAFLVLRRDQNLEAERMSARSLAQLGPVEVVTGSIEQREGAAQIVAVASGAVGDWRRPGAGEHVRPRRVGIGSAQRAFARVCGPPASGKLGSFEEARRAAEKIEEEIVVDPFGVEQEADRLAHADVREYGPSGIEHEGGQRPWQAGRERLLQDASVAYRRYLVGGLPASRIGFGADIDEPFFECLEFRIAVAIELEPDLVEVPVAPVDCEIAAPIVGIALEQQALSGSDIRNEVRLAAEWRRKRGL